MLYWRSSRLILSSQNPRSMQEVKLVKECLNLILVIVLSEDDLVNYHSYNWILTRQQRPSWGDWGLQEMIGQRCACWHRQWRLSGEMQSWASYIQLLLSGTVTRQLTDNTTSPSFLITSLTDWTLLKINALIPGSPSTNWDHFLLLVKLITFFCMNTMRGQSSSWLPCLCQVSRVWREQATSFKWFNTLISFPGMECSLKDIVKKPFLGAWQLIIEKFNSRDTATSLQPEREAC